MFWLDSFVYIQLTVSMSLLENLPIELSSVIIIYEPVLITSSSDLLFSSQTSNKVVKPVPLGLYQEDKKPTL